MVTTGQFLERPTLIPVDDGIVLEGLFHRGKKGGVIIAPPHPLFGGSMDNPVVAEMAYAFFKAGYSTLRFNYRGVGGSQGKPSGDPLKGVDDYLAAIKVERENTGEEDIIGSGYSFGAYITYLVWQRGERLKRMILLSPPTRLFGFDFEKIEVPTLIIAGGRDRFLDPELLEKAHKENPHIYLQTIPEADHFYFRGLAEIGRIIERWLQERE